MAVDFFREDVMMKPSSSIWNMTKIVYFAPFFGGYAMSCHIIGFGGMIVLHMTSS